MQSPDRDRHDGWYVVETRPRSEPQAVMHLERQGFRALWLRFRKTRRHARRIDQVLAPLFPNYLFVQFDRSCDNWTAINGTIGVRRLVGASAQGPQAMPSEAIACLLTRCDNGVMHSLMPAIEPGQRVRLVSGPFADRLASVERLDGHGRVRVLLDMLGGRTSVATRVELLGPVRA